MSLMKMDSWNVIVGLGLANAMVRSMKLGFSKLNVILMKNNSLNI